MALALNWSFAPASASRIARPVYSRNTSSRLGRRTLTLRIPPVDVVEEPRHELLPRGHPQAQPVDGLLALHAEPAGDVVEGSGVVVRW